jgi:uncharacterized membrane protein YeaQ/YmgE (transglycosylase-associated protein family)
MGIIAWIVFGFIVGLIARALVPGRQRMGFILTTLLGIAGSIVGGLVATGLAGGSPREMHPVGFLGSLIGAIVLLLIGIFATRSRRSTA